MLAFKEQSEEIMDGRVAKNQSAKREITTQRPVQTPLVDFAGVSWELDLLVHFHFAWILTGGFCP